MYMLWNNIAKQKRICLSIYGPLEHSNLTVFFDEITTTLSKTLLKSEKPY